jgi:hypothetical protein
MSSNRTWTTQWSPRSNDPASASVLASSGQLAFGWLGHPSSQTPSVAKHAIAQEDCEMSTRLTTERITMPGIHIPQASQDEGRGHAVRGTLALNREQHDCGEPLAYGAAFVKTLGPGSPTWENIGPLVRNGWASHHDQSCDSRMDWRLSWPAVREGWRDAGGAFEAAAPPSTTDAPPLESILPAQGAHVFDTFGEPAGRVKTVRDDGFLLARPLARDVYVPLSAIRWPGKWSLRVGVSNAQLGSMGWERPKLLGLFGGSRLPDASRKSDAASLPRGGLSSD